MTPKQNIFEIPSNTFWQDTDSRVSHNFEETGCRKVTKYCLVLQKKNQLRGTCPSHQFADYTQNFLNVFAH